jgi:small subunit ribosomal protein S5
VVKATINALAQLRDPYTIAKVRGVQLDTVFNG